MKALVVYSSRHGNTEKVARTIADTLGDGAKVVRINDLTRNMLDRTKVLIIGSPTQMLYPTMSILFLIRFRLTPRQLSRVKAAAFDTTLRNEKAESTAANKIDQWLRKKGVFMLAAPKKFIVEEMKGPLAEGEMENAKSWAMEIKGAYRVITQRTA